jgi:glycosyltransferase involved in cell wall biosynthesis
MFMTKGANPLVSIIIPAYNIEAYLPACLDSIVNQTYPNLEIMVIDDGSTDNTLEVAKAYAKRDKRVRVFHKENGGQGDARNVGYEKSTGDLIAYVDGDDYVSKYYIESMLNTMLENDADISTCQYKLVYTSNDHSLESKQKAKIELISGEDALKRLFYQTGVTTAPWGKLFKRELIAGIKFPKEKKYEDLATLYKIIAKANKVTISTEKLLYYMQSENSTMRRGFTPRRMDGLHFAEEAVDFVKAQFPNLEKAAINRAFTEAVYIFEEIVTPRKFKTEYDLAWATIKQYRSIVKSDKESKKNMRAYARVSYLGKQALRTALDAKERYGQLSARRLQK